MQTLTASLVTLLGVFTCGIVGYVIKLSRSMKQIEKQARAGEYDARNVRKLLRGIGMVGLAIAGVSLVLLVLMLLSKLPAIGFLVAGIFFLVVFVAIIPIDWNRQRLGGGQPRKHSQADGQRR